MKMKKEYLIKVILNEDIMNKIRKNLKNNIKGRTINNIMKDTNLSRGTVKLYLTALTYNKEVDEVNYNQNTKVYFLEGE